MKKQKTPVSKHIATQGPAPIAITTPHVHASAMGLVFDAQTTKEEWLTAGRSVLNAIAFSGFMLGDWLVFGETSFTKDEAGKTFYAEAEKMTGLDNGTLRNMKSVAKAFPPDKRRPNVSFEHHRLLASAKAKPETAALLDRIADEKLSVAAMKETEDYKAIKAKPAQSPEAAAAAEKRKRDEHDETCRERAQSLIEYFDDMPTEYQAGWHALISELGEAIKTVSPVISSAHRKLQAELQKKVDDEAKARANDKAKK